MFVRGIPNLRHLNEPFLQATLASLVQATKAMTTLLKESVDFVQYDRTLNCRRQYVFVTGESDDFSYFISYKVRGSFDRPSTAALGLYLRSAGLSKEEQGC